MKEENSSIPVSQERIIELAGTWLSKAKEKTELATNGITASFITDFEAEIAEANTFKTDKQIDKEAAALTANKDKKNTECYKWLKRAKLFYEKVFDKKTAESKLFPQNYTDAKKNESLMINIMPVVTELIDKNKEAMMGKGMPADFDTQGKTLLSELDALNKAQEKQKADNIAYTAERRITLSKLYNRINDINRAGKLSYENNSTMAHYFDSPWPRWNKKEVIEEPAEQPK